MLPTRILAMLFVWRRKGALSIIAAMTEAVGNEETDSVGLAKIDEVLQIWRAQAVRLEMSHIRVGFIHS
jgi:hypothetical protein